MGVYFQHTDDSVHDTTNILYIEPQNHEYCSEHRTKRVWSKFVNEVERDRNDVYVHSSCDRHG